MRECAAVQGVAGLAANFAPHLGEQISRSLAFATFSQCVALTDTGHYCIWLSHRSLLTVGQNHSQDARQSLLACDRADAAQRITAHWREATHDGRRDLVNYLVSRLTKNGPVLMYEVAMREMLERSLLC